MGDNSVGKIRWQREEGGTCVPYLLDPGQLRWVRYTSSIMHVPDGPHFSKGYKTFIEAKKAGYEVCEGLLK